MSHENQIVFERNGYKLNVIRTEKYKTNTVVWKMKAPLSEDTVTLRALLPYVLQSNTKKYPSNTVLRTYLEELYGAGLYSSVGKKGEYHIITFTMEVANEKFLSSNEPLLEKAIQLLSEVIFHPNIEQGAFQQKTVDEEKRNLKQRIQSLNDDKMKYSSIRLIEEMCKGEPYAIEVNGFSDQVDAITPSILYDYFTHAIETDEIDIYVVGDVDPEQVDELCCEYIYLTERKPQLQPFDRNHHVNEPKELKEVQDIAQGKLNIGYRSGIVYGDEKYYPLQVFNGIFGGFPHSKLFLEVREKNSLAYYAASRLESHKGLVIVMAGIQQQNYQKTVDIINEQMEAMKKGDFSDEIINQTKAVIENQLLETIDNQIGLVEVLYHDVIAGKTVSIEQWLGGIKNVTKEEIVEVANQVELDTIYFLAGTEVAQ